jgi:hypothetical protein
VRVLFQCTGVWNDQLLQRHIIIQDKNLSTSPKRRFNDCTGTFSIDCRTPTSRLT